MVRHKKDEGFFATAKDLQFFTFSSPIHGMKENLLGLLCYHGAGNSFKVLKKPKIRN